MSDLLEHDTPATSAGAPTMRGFLPGIHRYPDDGAGGGAGGGDAGAGDGGAAAAVVDPGAAAGAGDGDAAGAVVDPGASAAVAAPVPVWEDPAVLDLVDTRAQALLQAQMEPILPLLQQLIASGQGANGGAAQQAGQFALVDEFGQVDPNALASLLTQSQQQLLAQIDERFQQIQAPMEQRAQAETLAEGEQRLKDVLADDISRNGDFATDPETGASPGQTLVRPLADLFFPEFAARFGASPRAAEFAMQKAAGVVRQLEQVAGKVAIAKHTNQLETLAGAPGEPGAGGGAGVGVQTVGEIKARNLSEGLRSVTERHAAAIRAGA